MAKQTKKGGAVELGLFDELPVEKVKTKSVTADDLRQAIAAYCARYEHTGCGGHPVAFKPSKAGGMGIGCTRCEYVFGIGGNTSLGVGIVTSKQFVALDKK